MCLENIKNVDIDANEEIICYKLFYNNLRSNKHLHTAVARQKMQIGVWNRSGHFDNRNIDFSNDHIGLITVYKTKYAAFHSAFIGIVYNVYKCKARGIKKTGKDDAFKCFLVKEVMPLEEIKPKRDKCIHEP